MSDVTDIQPRLLAALLAVAEEGSLSRATSRLYVTQSAVTRQIASLERQLGLQLLDRNPRGVQPTEHALALLPYARAVVEANDQLVEQARKLARH